MKRWSGTPSAVVAFAGIVCAVGFAAGIAVDALGVEPVSAATIVVLAVGAFAWLRRERDVLDVAIASFALAYAGYVGLALARLPHVAATEWSLVGWWFGPFGALTPFDRDVVVLAAGVLFALVVTVAIVPMAALVPRRVGIARDAGAFWAFVDDHVARTEQRTRGEAAATARGPGAERAAG